MKKLALVLFVSLMLLGAGTVFASQCYGYDSLVPCGQQPSCPCEFSDIFTMILRVYNFILLQIATPLASLLLIIGGVMMIVSGGNAGLVSRGKQIIWWTVVSMLLMLGAWLIINTLMAAIGFTGTFS